MFMLICNYRTNCSMCIKSASFIPSYFPASNSLWWVKQRGICLRSILCMTAAKPVAFFLRLALTWWICTFSEVPNIAHTDVKFLYVLQLIVFKGKKMSSDEHTFETLLFLKSFLRLAVNCLVSE